MAKNPRKRRSAAQQAATAKMLAANRRRRKNPTQQEIARRRVTIKRQLRRSGVSVDPTTATGELRALRKKLGHSTNHLILGAISKSAGKLVFWDGFGWSLLRENAARIGTLQTAKQIAGRQTVPVLIAREGISSEAMRARLMGKA